MENEKFDALKVDIEKSLKTIETEGTGTKLAIKKLEDQFSALNKAMDDRRLESKSHPLFGNQKNATDFVDVLRGAVAGNPVVSNRIGANSPLHVSKSDLNTYSSGHGLAQVPTATANVISMLLSQGGVARREATVLEGLHEKVVLPKRNGTSTAAFTTDGSSGVGDDQAITPAAPADTSITISPSQVAALAKVSEKLLYMSAINVAEFIATDMIEQAGVLEDNCVIRGDASNTYGLITGINTQSGIVESTVAFGSFDMANVLALSGLVAEAAQSSPNAKYYMSGAVLAILQAQKSSAGGFYVDPSTGITKLAGRDVVIWHRLDNTIATGKFPVYFGDLKKALVVGTGRDYQISVDHSVYFNSVQAAFRLVYDFDAKFIQATAMARLKCLIS